MVEAYIPLTPGDRAYSDDQNLLSAEEKLLAVLIPGENYAWGKTTNYLCKQALDRAYQNTTGRFVAVDLCSALPVWPQIMRERHFESCYSQAVRIVGETIYHLQTNQDRLPESQRIPTIERLDQDARRKLKDRVSLRRSRPRMLLQAAVQQILFDPPEANEQTVHNELLDYLNSSSVTFGKIFEREDFVGRGRWEIIMKKLGITTFAQILKDLVGDEYGQPLLEEISQVIARKVSPRLRSYSVLSLDIAHPQTIRDDMHKNLPKSFAHTEFFGRAASLRDHIQADVLSLPFAPNSVSFYSSVEGYPYYLSKVPPENHYSFAESIYKTLKPGGVAIFAPFSFRPVGKYPTNQARRDLENYWRSRGMIVTDQVYPLDMLRKQMGDRELLLTHVSPIFTDRRRKNLRVLVIEKPVALAHP